MRNEMYLVDQASFFENAKKLDNGEEELLELPASTFGLKPYAVPKPAGYRHPNNFPNCCEYHTDLFARARRLFDKFPNCCAGHRRLNTATWFRVFDYISVPFKVLSFPSYLLDRVNEYHAHPNWRKELTDYIDYLIRSFGQFPDGYGPPLGLSMFITESTSMIEQHPLLTEYQKQALVKCLQPEGKEIEEPTNLHLLHKAYKEWVNLFPFDLPIFRQLKPIIEDYRPFLKGPGETNRYTGLTCFKLTSPAALKNLLLGMTRLLLQEINSAKLFSEGLLLEPEKLRLNMILQQRRIRLEEDVLAPPSEKMDFIRLLDKWLNDEKDFLKDINEYVYKNSPMQFIADLICGIQQLQKNGINEPCVKNIRESGSNKESLVRYWFRNWFQARYPDAVVTVEEEHSDKYMDLKVVRSGAPDRIIEFKGWWNADKIDAPQQLCSYLTDFEREGYIFMINDCKRKQIDHDYQAMVMRPAMNYITGSWRSQQHGYTDFYFHRSCHQFEGKIKTINHFIFNAHF